MTRPREIFRYIYLDEAGINSLFAQTTDRLETERSETRKKAKSESLVAKLGIGAPLAFLQLLKADFQAKTENSNGSDESSKSILTPEQKLRRLIEYLQGEPHDQLITDISVATHSAVGASRPVFLLTTTTFDLPQFYSEEGFASVNDTQTVLWRRPTAKEGGWDTFSSFVSSMEDGRDTKIIMTTSLHKHPSAYDGKLGRTSHDAVMFRALKGMDVPVSIFGLLSHLPDGFHIKPFAIWL